MTNIIKQFIKNFFKKNKDNFYILKTEVDINELQKQLNELIKKLDEFLNIPLRIDPRILELCESGKDSKIKSGKYLRKYFTNNKKEFKELYNRTNRLLTSKNEINMHNLLRISKKNSSKIATYLKTDTSSELKIKLISEIRLRKFAIECGFETWGQLKNMFRLFKYIYKNGLEKYFDFDINTNIDINTNKSNANNNSNSEFLRGINLHRGNTRRTNNNNNGNNHTNEWWTYNNPRSRALHSNISNGSFRMSGYSSIPTNMNN